MNNTPKELIEERFRHADLTYEPVKTVFTYCTERSERVPDAARPIIPPIREETDKLSEVAAKREVKIVLHQLVNNKIELPSLPDIFSRLMALMNDTNSSSKDFADIIITDPALSAKLLKLVNSAFFGYAYRSRIDSVSMAVAVVGIDGLFSLVLGMSVMRMFKDIPKRLMDMPSFWKHSIACGVISRLIAVHKDHGEIERFFVAGLLHDIGRLMIFKYLPAHAKNALNDSAENHLLLHDTENSIMGFDHSWLGSILLKKWKLPDHLISIVRFHHEPSKASNHSDVAIIHLADFIANALSLGSSGELFVPPLLPVDWDQLEMDADTLPQLMEEAEKQVSETISIMI